MGRAQQQGLRGAPIAAAGAGCTTVRSGTWGGVGGRKGRAPDKAVRGAGVKALPTPVGTAGTWLLTGEDGTGPL